MAASTNDTAELLARVPVFETLGHEDLEQVARVAVPRGFEPGEVVFREGDESDTCYVVRSGHARAVRAHPDGRTITLASFGPGDIFGELAMFDAERRSASNIASSPKMSPGPNEARVIVRPSGCARTARAWPERTT